MVGEVLQTVSLCRHHTLQVFSLPVLQRWNDFASEAAHTREGAKRYEVQRCARFGRETPADSGEPPFSLWVGKGWARGLASLGAKRAQRNPNTSGAPGPARAIQRGRAAAGWKPRPARPTMNGRCVDAPK